MQPGRHHHSAFAHYSSTLSTASPPFRRHHSSVADVAHLYLPSIIRESAATGSQQYSLVFCRSLERSQDGLSPSVALLPKPPSRAAHAAQRLAVRKNPGLRTLLFFARLLQTSAALDGGQQPSQPLINHHRQRRPVASPTTCCRVN